MRKDYKHLYNEKVFKRNSGSFYKCPNCNKWVQGDNLYIMNDRYAHLGRRRIIRTSKD
jgi:uncharacterized C2H2 Zn-finger protein